MNRGAFIQDLAVVMAAAGFVSVICARYRWPKVLGYIFAGILMGAATWGGSFLADATSVMTIGELGVVFLMFSMGLDFSPAQMKRIKHIALPVAIFDTVVMTWLGYTVGTVVFGWGMIPSLFLGAAICDSATTMLSKIAQELGWGERPFVRYALGCSVCEDMFCIGIVALVTGVSNGGGVSIWAVASSLGGLVVFLSASAVVGFVLVPRLLLSVARRRDNEALLLAILGCCFLVCYTAEYYGLSLALGAFIVGVVGASSVVRNQLVQLVAPLRSMFAAVFFVSIGLLVDPAACIVHSGKILALVAVVVLGKFFNCAMVALLSGERVKTAVQLGMSLAQIGEFAFMVAILYAGMTGDVSTGMYQIVVAVSLITTMLNPWMMRFSEPVGEWAERNLPKRFNHWLCAYRMALEKFRSRSSSTNVGGKVTACLWGLAILGVLEFAFSVVFSALNGYDWSKFSVFFNEYKRLFFCFFANLTFVSFFIPAFRLSTILGNSICDAVVGDQEASWQRLVSPLIREVIRVVALALFFMEMVMLNATMDLAPKGLVSQLVIVGLLIVAGLIGWRRTTRLVQRAVVRLEESLTADERRAKLTKMLAMEIPGDVVHRVVIPPGSPAVGATAVTLNIRAKTGASVISVRRDGDICRNPGAEFEFRIGDELTVYGDARQFAALKDLLGVVAAEVVE